MGSIIAERRRICRRHNLEVGQGVQGSPMLVNPGINLAWLIWVPGHEGAADSEMSKKTNTDRSLTYPISSESAIHWGAHKGVSHTHGKWA